MKLGVVRTGSGILLALGSAAIAMAQPDDARPRPIPNMAGKVLTVNGPIDPSALGETLMHEHIFIDFKKPPAMVPPPTDITVIKYHEQGTPIRGLTDFGQSLVAVAAFKGQGGGTIVDVSNFGLTRDPLALKLISNASGLNVVMGAGWYMHMNHPPDMDQLTVEQLTDIIVQDVTVGAQGTAIRAGIIGEVGVGDFEAHEKGHPLSANEIKSVRASARAARITGAPMSIHNFEALPEMLQVFDILAAEGVDPGRVVMSHTGGKDHPCCNQQEIMDIVFEHGSYVEWDFMGQAPLSAVGGAEVVESIYEMIVSGHARQIILSHDICTPGQLKSNGGGGYTYINDAILPGLRAKGVSEEILRAIMYENPRRVLTFVAPATPTRR